MRQASNLARFFIYSNLFIACCAVLMVFQTYQLLLNSFPGINITGFIFFATICSYSFHWWLTPATTTPSSRINWLKLNRQVHLRLFFIGLAGVLFFTVMLMSYWYWLLLSAGITFLYSAPMIPHPWFRLLRKIAVGKTVFLALVWMHATTILPLLVSDQPWRQDFTLFAAGRFFLIYAICVLFDYRDRDYDRSIGIRSLITWLSPREVRLLFACSLILFAVLTAQLIVFDYSRLDLVLLLLPGVITASLFLYATRHASDILYYFILDGMMALSSMLMLVERLKYL